MIYTSYFSKMKKLPDNFYPVSISLWTPKGITIPSYPKLAPTKEILSSYKSIPNQVVYIKDYTSQILDKLDTKVLFDELEQLLSNSNPGIDFSNIASNPNNHVVLCCYEKPSDFCHRHLIAYYLEKNYGIKVDEFDENKIQEYKKESESMNVNDVELSPLSDGSTHINIYSKGNTELGKFLTNMSLCPIETEDGKFNTIEGYWHYLKYPNFENRDAFKTLSGYDAMALKKDIEKQGLPVIRDEHFEEKIKEAVRLKFQTKICSDILTRNQHLLGLPLTHYYYYGEKDNCKVIDRYDQYKWWVDCVQDEISSWRDTHLEVTNENQNANGNGKTMCFTGRRPKDLFGYKDKESYNVLMKHLYRALKPLVEQQGFTTFISGTAQGFDQLAFRVVHKLKKDFPDKNIKNIAYMPYRTQGDAWVGKDMFTKADLDAILRVADDVVYVNEEYTPYCLHQRNHAMVDNSDAVFGLYPDASWQDKDVKGGTSECLKYALKNNKDIYQLTYDDKDKLNTLALKHYDSTILNEPISQTPKGDALFGVTKGLICQQVNCMGVMGAGLAKAILEAFPIVKERFDNNYDANMGFQFGVEEIVRINDELAVVNIYSQEGYGNAAKTGIIYTNADKLITSIKKIASTHPNEDIYIPLNIGCGFGGEKWENIYPRIKALGLENIHILDTKARTSMRCVNPILREEIPVNLLDYQAELANKYGYKPQPTGVAMENFKLYYDNLPDCFKTKSFDAIEILPSDKGYELPAIDLPIISKEFSQIADKYDRIVVGQYGAFIEIDDKDIHLENLRVQPGQEYRITDERFSKSVKYQWYTCRDGSNCKLYFQQHGVSYADYKPGKWYISPYEVQSRENNYSTRNNLFTAESNPQGVSPVDVEEQLELESAIISSDNHGIDLD